MANTLVAYFSATGRTAKVAKLLAEVLGADIHEIRPKVPYTRADLNWLNKKIPQQCGNEQQGLPAGNGGEQCANCRI